MYNKFRKAQFEKYQDAKEFFINHHTRLIDLERFLADEVEGLVVSHRDEIKRDYDEASFLFPFWKNYPPEERGRSPIGDQVPWIEVGEHVIGAKLSRMLALRFSISDPGIPAGADERFLLKSPAISTILGIDPAAAWLFTDIKSVGPRDDAPHAVMSHNQVSGDGLWIAPEEGVRNTILKASGQRASHDFHCSLPPLYILSDETVACVVNIVIKPLYEMLSLKELSGCGQPLCRITLATIPNGLLLLKQPAYLKSYPHLFFPGKDDKGKNPLKVRARVSFDDLRQIDPWRVKTIDF